MECQSRTSFETGIMAVRWVCIYYDVLCNFMVGIAAFLASSEYFFFV